MASLAGVSQAIEAIYARVELYEKINEGITLLYRAGGTSTAAHPQYIKCHFQKHKDVCSLVMGSAYPVYASFSLLESSMPAEEKQQAATQWLTYWAIYGIISAAEQLFETRPPLYYHIKLAFLLWLQNSRYQGARRLYVLFLRPFLHTHKPQIDAGISLISEFMAKPGMTYVGHHIHNLVEKVPYLNWFVQPFDEAVHKPFRKS